MKLFTLRGVAVAPPTSTSVKPEKVAGADIVGLGLRTELRPLTALFPTEIQTPTGPLEILTGEKIFVAVGQLAAQRWVKEKFVVDGVEFVIVPPEVIFAIGAKEVERPKPSDGEPR